MTHPPTVRIRVGTPVDLQYRSVGADTKRIMAAIMDLLPPRPTSATSPTPEELARTLPSGYKQDPEKEPSRRPGTD